MRRAEKINCPIAGIGHIAATRFRGPIEVILTAPQAGPRDEETIICLHGIQGDRSLFDRLTAEPFLESYDLLAIDLPGFGESSKPESWDYNLESHAAAVLDVIAQLGLGRVHLIGHSLGGMIATLLTLRAAERILSVVSLEGNLTLEDCGLSRDIAGIPFQQFAADFFPELKKKLRTSQEPSAPFRLSALEAAGALAFYKISQSIVSWAKSGSLKIAFETAPCPKLLLYGEAGSFKSRVDSPWCRQEAIPDAGHFLLHDNYANVAAAIRKFFDR